MIEVRGDDGGWLLVLQNRRNRIKMRRKKRLNFDIDRKETTDAKNRSENAQVIGDNDDILVFFFFYAISQDCSLTQLEKFFVCSCVSVSYSSK